jgi:outer membrane protein OmpA-like peptidoglycan-associated protein
VSWGRGGVVLAIVLGACVRDPVVPSPSAPGPSPPSATHQVSKPDEIRTTVAVDEPCPADLAEIVGIIEGLEFTREYSWQISASSHDRLDHIADVLRRHVELDIEIAGHLGSIPEQYVRQRPSQRRAEAVRDYLIHRGVDPQRIHAVGYGEDRPIADHRTPEGQARNERVELLIVDAPWADGCGEPP